MKKMFLTMMMFGLAGIAHGQCQNFGNKSYGGFNRYGQMHKMGGYQQMPQKHYGGYNQLQQMPMQYGGHNLLQQMPRQYGGNNRFVQQPHMQRYGAQPTYGFGQRGGRMMNRYSPFTQTQPGFRRSFLRR